MKKIVLLLVTINITTLMLTSASAKELFVLSGESMGQSGYFATSSIEELASAFDNTSLNEIFSGYTDTSAVTTDLSVRGLNAHAQYLENSTTLYFQVLSLGIDMQFNGRTRDESQDKFVDFFKGKEGQSLLTKFLQGLVSESPVDPVAGNPNSLQAQMTGQTFGAGTGIGSISDPGSSLGKKGMPSGIPSLLYANGEIGVADAGGYKTTFVTLPLRYSIYFEDPRYALTFDLPLTYMDTEGTQSGVGSFGVSMRVPAADNWYLSPSIRIGATGSEDLGAAALMYSADITSLYNIYTDDLKISIGNGLGYYKTAELSFGDTTINYDLTNQALKNGVSVEGSAGFTLLGRPTSWQAYLVDTYMFGDKLYIDHYDELGVVVGSRESMDGQNWDALKLGLSWTFGDNYNAFKMNFGYRF